MRKQAGNKIIIIRQSPDIYLLSSHPHPIPHPHLTHQPTIKNIQRVPSTSAYCMRQCCRRKEEVQQRLSKEKQSRIKQLTARSIEHQSVYILQKEKRLKRCYHKPSKLSPLNQEQQKQAKPNVYILPNVKQFSNEGIRESESRHKVFRQDKKLRLATQGNTNQHYLPPINPIRLKSTHQHKSPCASRALNQSYIDATPLNRRQSTRKTQNPLAKEQRESSDAKTSPSKRYYKYIENYPKTQGQRITHSKIAHPDEDLSQSISSLDPHGNNASSTIFHSNKLRFTHVKVKSLNKLLLSDQCKYFDIPQTEEALSNFLIKYKPLNPQFNVKHIAKTHNFEVLPQEDRVFFGQTKNGQKHGQGLLLTQKELYQGEFSQNHKVHGSQKTSIGVYSGHFLNGKRHGHGSFHWQNGEHFQGDWSNGKKNGHGIWKSHKGDFYQGQWKHNKQNGKGFFVHVGGSKYTGYFKDFLKHGRGQQEFANGDKYSGQYKEGMPDGYGKYQWANGDIYEGDFKCGSRNGQGLLLTTNGDSFQGKFQNDLKHGTGKQKYSGGSYFVGQFREGQKVKGELYSKQGVLLEQL